MRSIINHLSNLVALQSDGLVSGAATDPFDVPATNVDTSVPRLQPQVYDLNIAEATVATSKKSEDRQTLTLVLKTTVDAISTDGETVNAGFPIYHYIGVTPTAERPAGKIAADIARVCKAAGLNLTTREVLRDPKQLTDHVVRCKVKIQKATDEFPEKNSIASFSEVK